MDVDFYFVIFTFIYISRPGRPVGQSGFNFSQTEEIGILKIRNIRCRPNLSGLGPGPLGSVSRMKRSWSPQEPAPE